MLIFQLVVLLFISAPLCQADKGIFTNPFKLADLFEVEMRIAEKLASLEQSGTNDNVKRLDHNLSLALSLVDCARIYVKKTSSVR